MDPAHPRRVMASLSLSDKCFNAIRLWEPLTIENLLNMQFIILQTIDIFLNSLIRRLGGGVFLFCLDVLGMCFIKVHGKKKKKNGSPYHQGRVSVSLPK